MTIEELEKLGFYHMESKLYPRRFFMPILGEKDIPEYYKLENIFEIYYNKGYSEGIDKGIEIKTNKFRTLLGFDEI